jgi:hypothetical protein
VAERLRVFVAGWLNSLHGTAWVEAVEQLGLRGAVIMIGDAPAEPTPDVYRMADVVVSIPSGDSSPRSVWDVESG